jgi:hypothetical protein
VIDPFATHQPPRCSRWRQSRRRLFSTLSGLLLSTAALCWAVSAGAAGGARVAVDVKGAGAAAIRAQVIAALPAGVEVTDARNVVREVARRALFDRDATPGDGDRLPDLIGQVQRAVHTAGIDALVLGETRPGGRKGLGALQLVIVPAPPGTRIADETVSLRQGLAPPNRLKNLLAAALEGVRRDPGATQKGDGAGAGAVPPSVAAGEDHAAEGGAEPGDSASSLDAPRNEVSPTEALLVGLLGLDLGGRQFHYNQRITNANLRPYDLPQAGLLPVTPGGIASVELYPLARTRWAVARDIGVGLGGGYNFAKAQLGTVKLDTTWYEWDVYLRGRLHLGARGASSVIGFEGGYGRQVFTFKDAGGLADSLPGVNYHYLRVGLDGRVPVGRLALIAGAAFRHLLTRAGPMGTTLVEAGSVGDHFPRAQMSGLDARLGAALPLGHNLEAVLLLGYVRYWAAFNSRPGDTYIAGGAVDHFIHADLGVALSF